MWQRTYPLVANWDHKNWRLIGMSEISGNAHILSLPIEIIEDPGTPNTDPIQWQRTYPLVANWDFEN